jgi:hypothetical protein
VAPALPRARRPELRRFVPVQEAAHTQISDLCCSVATIAVGKHFAERFRRWMLSLAGHEIFYFKLLRYPHRTVPRERRKDILRMYARCCAQPYTPILIWGNGVLIPVHGRSFSN